MLFRFLSCSSGFVAPTVAPTVALVSLLVTLAIIAVVLAVGTVALVVSPASTIFLIVCEDLWVEACCFSSPLVVLGCLYWCHLGGWLNVD